MKTFGVDLILNYSSFNLFLIKVVTKNLDLAVVKSSFKVLLDDSGICKSVYRRRSLSSTGNDYLNFIAKGYDVTQNGDLIILR
jgi:hypothetical protein